MKYFKLSEFDSKLEKGSGKNMKKSTLDKLEKAREIYGQKISINSAFRVEADYQRIKSQGFEIARNSSHFLGYAVDLRPTDFALGANSLNWMPLLNALWDAGFRRFGIMRGAIHVDDDPGKPSPAMWKYSNTHSSVWRIVSKWFEDKRRKK